MNISSSHQSHFESPPQQSYPAVTSDDYNETSDQTSVRRQNADSTRHIAGVRHLMDSPFLADLPSFVSPTPPREKRELPDEQLSSVVQVNKRQCRPRSPPGCFKPKETRDLKTSFLILKHVGEGTFGSVFLTQERTTGDRFIIKRIKIMQDRSISEYGFPYTALREIKILDTLNHENIVKLKEVVRTTGNNGQPEMAFLVLEYIEYDLAALLGLPELTKHLTDDHIKSWSHQLLLACHYLHTNAIMHRDLKPSNILISKNGTLKLADFGLARQLLPGRLYTNAVASLWYRAPELLLGSTTYDTQIDLWSVGCVLAELSYRQGCLFKGDDFIHQCQLLFQNCCDDHNWLPVRISSLANRKVQPTDNLQKLIQNLLKLNPVTRWSAGRARMAEYFSETPSAKPASKLPMNLPRPSAHDMDVIKRTVARQQHELKSTVNKWMRG